VTKVLVADDSSIIRKVIVDLLISDPEIEVVGQCGSFAQTIRLAALLHPDIILLDVHLSDERVFTYQQVNSSLVGFPILAMSIWKDDETKKLAEIMGAEKLLDKTTLAAELIPTIKLIVTEVRPGRLKARLHHV
jgi:two-component system response regulator DevR